MSFAENILFVIVTIIWIVVWFRFWDWLVRWYAEVTNQYIPHDDAVSLLGLILMWMVPGLILVTLQGL